LAGKCNDLGNDELCNAARIGKGGVENSDAMTGSVFKIDLIGPNAKASHHQKVLCFA